MVFFLHISHSGYLKQSGQIDAVSASFATIRVRGEYCSQWSESAKASARANTGQFCCSEPDNLLGIGRVSQETPPQVPFFALRFRPA